MEPEKLPDLEKDGLRICVEWSGPRARGYDLPPSSVRTAVEAEIEAAGPAECAS